MEIDKETQEKLREFQITEQNLQNFLLQSQTFQMELNETESAMEEVSKTGDEVYKIVGQVMVKSNKEGILKELQEMKDILNLKLKAITNQEKILEEKIKKLRKEIESRIK